MQNSEIAKAFFDLANLLDIKGENPFKVRAYKNAARVIEGLGESIEKMVHENKDLTKLPGIGKEIAKKIQELVTTGKLSKLEEVKKEIPPTLLELLSIEGLGPKKVHELYTKLKITNLEELQKAAKEHKIAKLKGFGTKTEEKILKGMHLLKQEGIRFLYATAKPIAQNLLAYLKKAPTIEKVVVAGSFRRAKESVGDLDILATAKEPALVIDYFTQHQDIIEIVSAGDTKATVILKNMLQVDLRVVQDSSFGAALQYFTGSKTHTIALRNMALDMGIKMNEYGVFKKDMLLASKEEIEVYKSIGLSYIEPELRENRGEIEAAAKNALPKLITLQDIKGDLHMHSTFSDGIEDIKTMAQKAKMLGYEYIAISDHSATLALVKGVDEKKLQHYLQEIEKAEAEVGIKIFKAMEVDILEDGSLGVSKEILKHLDFAWGAIHSKFNLSKTTQTKRIIKALQNPYIKGIAHISGRIIAKRAPIEIDYEAIFHVLIQENKLLELNAQPERLDVSDIYAKKAKEMGVKFAINSDAHSSKQLEFMEFGINQARRGWLEAKDVINCFTLEKIKTILF